MIIETFNTVFIGLILLIIILTVSVWYFFRDKSENVKKWFIVGACSFNIIFFFIYKIALSMDNEYIEIYKFSWWNELPLQLCNINMFLIPISLLTKKRFLMGFSFFIAPLGAVMALLFPEPAFTGYSIFLMRNIGFYGTHGLLIVFGISLVTLGFFKPNFKVIPLIILTLLVLSIFMHGLNSLLRGTVYSHVNYFYTYPNDISILQLFYTWLPIPLLYMSFGLIILAIYTYIVTLPFTLKKHKLTLDN